MMKRRKCPNDIDLANFESETRLIIPKDLEGYFLSHNNGNKECNEHMYCFYALYDFKSVESELKNWGGIPDYSNLVNTLENHKDCFVFAEYMFHMFTYAIRLYKESTADNEIYVLCGDKYKVIAKSFSGFMELYDRQAGELQF